MHATATDLTLRDVSRITGYRPPQLRTLARNGRLPGSYKLGRRWLVNRQVFEKVRTGTAIVNSDDPAGATPR